jgi:hypothetical protein
MKYKPYLLAGVVALAAALASVVAFAATPASAARPQVSAPTAPISAAQSGNVLNGVFTLTGVSVNSAGQLVANGVFTGTATINGVTQLITSTASAVVTNASPGSCQVLDLVLGPLHLDLLGLVVDLNQVHLNVTAVPGPGNLLGNLLCAVTHLLDQNGGLGAALQNLINQLNAILGSL